MQEQQSVVCHMTVRRALSIICDDTICSFCTCMYILYMHVQKEQNVIPAIFLVISLYSVTGITDLLPHNLCLKVNSNTSGSPPQYTQ